MKCLSCGAEISYNPKLKKIKCDYCGSLFDPSDYKGELKNATEYKEPVIEKDNYIDVKKYSCTQCGATLMTFDDTAVTFCSYCGSSIAIEPMLNKEQPPEYIIPFKITRDECEKLYKNKVNKFIFAPSHMKEDIEIKKFRGIYMPYGIYKISHHGKTNNTGSVYDKRIGDYVYYRNYLIECDVNTDYDGISYDLASKFNDKFSYCIAPFNFNESLPFNPSYLSGFYADSRDVKNIVYRSEAISIAKNDAQNRLRKEKTFINYGCSNPTISMQEVEVKYAYYPVYFLSIRNNKDNTINYAVINGQTGKTAVELPIDFKKYLIFSVLLAIPIFLLFNFAFVIVPEKVLYIALVSSIVSLILSIVQLKALKKQETNEDDKGAIKDIKNDKETKSKKNSIMVSKYLFKQIIAIILCVITIIVRPINDIYYYIPSIISFLMVVWSFLDLVKEFNMLCSKKLSQLYARGGDENE